MHNGSIELSCLTSAMLPLLPTTTPSSLSLPPPPPSTPSSHPPHLCVRTGLLTWCFTTGRPTWEARGSRRRWVSRRSHWSRCDWPPCSCGREGCSSPRWVVGREGGREWYTQRRANRAQWRAIIVIITKVVGIPIRERGLTSCTDKELFATPFRRQGRRVAEASCSSLVRVGRLA